MKDQSIRTLFQVKQMVLECPHLECSNGIIEKINSVLLNEVGPQGVLYPYNNQDETVLELWHECHSIEYIAAKTGVPQDIVQNIVEVPENYKNLIKVTT